MSIPTHIQNKIDKLRTVYLLAEDQPLIDQLERDLRKRIAEGKLAENDTVKLILDDAERKIEEINYLLAYDESLGDQDRKALFRERRAHRFYLQRFGRDVQEYLRRVETTLDEKLSTA